MPLAAVDSYWAILVGTLALILAAVTMLRRHQFRTTSLRDMAREQLARLRDQREVQAALDDLLVQLEEVSRRVAAQVETRYAKLECVIRDADQRIARLEALSRGALPGSPPAAAPRRAAAPADATAFQPGLAAAVAAPAAAPTPAAPYPGAPCPAAPAPAAPCPSAPCPGAPTPGAPAPGACTPAALGAPAAPASGVPAEGVPAAPRSERFRRIYEMADAGTSALAIADALQIPLGEVELILGLRRLRK